MYNKCQIFAHVTLAYQSLYSDTSFSLPSSFKQFLELEPQLRDVIHQFHQSHYTSCLQTLEEMRENLMLDMYLASHLSKLYKMIRNKALIQVSPKLCSNTFDTTMEVDIHHLLFSISALT